MSETSTFGFSWEFLNQMSIWSLGIAAVAAVGGALVTGRIAFAVSCLVAATIDVLLVRFAVRHAQRTLYFGNVDAMPALLMTAGRLLVKAGLLVLALAAPSIMSFPGTVVGVLTFDVTLSFVGSIVAAVRMGRGGSRKGVAR
jgi:hypothetical protein